MHYYEQLFDTKDYKRIGGHSAVAYWSEDVKHTICFYLHGTCICTADILNKTFELRNGYYESITTGKAIRNYYYYLRSLGFTLADTDLSSYAFIAQDIIHFDREKRKGKNMISNQDTIISCNHIGKNGKDLKSIPSDEVKLCPNNKDKILHIQPWCYLRGRNLNEIIKYIQEIKGFKYAMNLEIVYSDNAPEYAYAIWQHKEDVFVFKLRCCYYRWNRAFTECSASYTPIDIYSVPEPEVNLWYMLGINDFDYDLVELELHKCQKL